MPHEIKLEKNYISITKLDPITLPDFTVLTGKNGTGKSHFLAGLGNGAITSDCAPIHKEDVLLLGNGSLGLVGAKTFDERSQIEREEKLLSEVKKQISSIKKFLSSFPAHTNSNSREELAQNAKQVLFNSKMAGVCGTTTLQTTREVSEQRNTLIQLFGKLNRLSHGFSQREPEFRLEDFSPEEMINLLFMTDEEILNYSGIVWGRVSGPFSQAFTSLFGRYRRLYSQNLKKIGAKSSGDSDANPLSTEEFQSKYGLPPWDVINKVFADAKLDFKLNEIDLFSDLTFDIKLTKISTGAEVAFEALSSGEKVLLSFVTCLFNVTDSRQVIHLPKLILLDEVDAPLHPSMLRDLLHIIRDVLVENNGVKVILATHSPTTVALADDECLFEMRPNSITKVTKNRALNLLTEGVPTLAISYEGRRQVFVESHTDAKIYGKLYEQYRKDLDSERSLTFIGVGKTRKIDGVEQEQNSGCGQVKSIVKKLVNSGAESVLGLIDWDKKNKQNGKVFVLSENQRYSVENLVLDPVLLTLAVVRLQRGFAQNVLKLHKVDTIREVDDWSDEVWQDNIDLVTTHILEAKKEDLELVEVNYLEGKTFRISKDLLEMNGHKLEVLAGEKLKISLKTEADSLPMYIVKSILPEYRGFVPMDLITSFKLLLNS